MTALQEPVSCKVDTHESSIAIKLETHKSLNNGVKNETCQPYFTCTYGSQPMLYPVSHFKRNRNTNMVHASTHCDVSQFQGQKYLKALLKTARTFPCYVFRKTCLTLNVGICMEFSQQSNFCDLDSSTFVRNHQILH